MNPINESITKIANLESCGMCGKLTNHDRLLIDKEMRKVFAQCSECYRNVQSAIVRYDLK